ncbi:hypothetical protein Tco_0918993 [Tanacetum coccineum]
MAPLPHCNLRHPWLLYQVDRYDKGILDGARRRMTWKQFILALGLHSEEEMEEPGFGAYWSGSERVILDKGDLKDYWIEILSDRDFLGPAPSYVHIRDPIRRLCHRMIACSISGRAQGAEKGRKSEARFSRGHFIGRIVAYFGLVGDQGLRGLSMVVSELLVIDLHELDMLNICARFGDIGLGLALYLNSGRPSPAPLPLNLFHRRIDRLEEEAFDLHPCQQLMTIYGEARQDPGQSMSSQYTPNGVSKPSGWIWRMDESGRPCYKEINDMVYSEKDVC